MKKILALLLSIIIFGTCFGCGGGETPPPAPPAPPTETGLVTDLPSIKYGFEGMYSGSELIDEDHNFGSVSDIKGARFLENGEFIPTFTSFNSRRDVKMEFYNDDYARLVNVSAGMAFTVPAKEKLEIDYSIAKYRTQITLGDSILTASFEASNPYIASSDPWGTYRDEWILRWLKNDKYINANGLQRVGDVTYGNSTLKEGHEIYQYSVEILDENNKIERPFYNIGIVRMNDDLLKFGMFVMKSKVDRQADMLEILSSYSQFVPKGVTKNYYDAGEPKADENWNEDTKAYYNSLLDGNRTDWGAFSYSMPGDSDSLEPGSGIYDAWLKKSVDMQAAIEEAWGHDFDIFPTYTHISYGTSMHHFPSKQAEVLAGGNGTNGKPVLQFTYQFTTNNNDYGNDDVQYTTPMFDVLRGEFDDHFKKLARDIKAYGKPILFRLNNEMNTDWTSYAGLMTLCDPDIFQMTWRYLFDLFEAEGVDNCIWIWNPIEKSCPYSSWGEDLSYNPGADYVHLLGLTGYEFNNLPENEIKSFENLYSNLYKKNSPAWGKYPAIISEFACGSGGNLNNTVLGRNRNAQAKWVKEMFEQLNSSSKKDYAKQIVGAVWFNTNDYSDKLIKNRLRFIDPENKDYNDLTATLNAFKLGFNPTA